MLTGLLVEKLPQKAEKPLRSQILSREAMVARAAEIAERYSIHPSKVRGARLQKRFKDNCRLLEKAYYAFSESSKNKEPLSAGAEWLLDNYHVVEEQVREIRRDLPKSYYKALPKIADSEWAGYPRVYQLACSFVSHTDASFDIEVLSTFVDSYQTKRILQIGEIWAVPIMLRLALVENLRRLAEAGLLARENRRKAESFCKLAIDPSGQAGAEMLIEFVNRLNQNVEVLDLGATHLLRRLRSKGAPALLTLQWLDQKLKEKGIEPDLLTRQEQQTQAADQISFGNTVTALKTIGSLNWREWFERVSRVDQVLAQDLVYKKCDFITRDRYRHRIELLARKTNKSEVDVSQALIDFCKEQSQSLSAKDRYAQRISHIGYYLIDEGRGEFGRSLSLSEMSSGAYGEKLSESSFALYLSGIILITLAISAMAWDWMRIYGAEEWQTALVAILVAMVASDFATHLVQWIVTRLVQPKPLPKLDFELGVPDECTTVVTVQTIVSDREALDRLIAALEIRFIGNDDKNIMFALLADLSDASSEILPGDRGLMNHASELINDLNRRYCQDSPTRFFVLFRRRLWNEKESRWMAYERKRGKISEFNRLLRGAADTSFNLIVGSLEALRRAKYVITLDSDTQLPPGSARKLIGTIAHPLNAAIFAEDMPSFTEKRKGVVVRGYGVLQPRVGITLESAQASVFASVMSGSSGLDPYTLTVSDVYQDLFGDGSYIGKGIYELDTFERALRGRVPDNALLSHDLFEGLFARTGLVTDVELFDEFPSRVHAYYKRQHRWIRGDWQLVPWIWGSIPDAAHRRYASPISALGRWKLIDNLRRSLVAPSLLLLLICMWLVVPGSHLAWLAALLLALSFSVYSGVVSAVSGWQFGYSLTNYVKHVYRDIKKSIEQLLLGLIFLPHLAFHNLHAILVTLWRVVCSKKHLLEWETAHSAERRLGGDLLSFLRSMWAAPIAALAIAVLVAALEPEHLVQSLPWAWFWLGAPIIAWWVSLPFSVRKESISDSDRNYLRDIAFSTWEYFDSYLKPEYNYLIPDNLQLVPKKIVAERTSPTNISLSVLGVVSAYDMGFIPVSGVIERLKGIFDTLMKLERFHGHFINWYEIRELRPLPPRYISTVDSGNLVGHFIAAKEALCQLANSPIIAARHLEFVAHLAGNSFQCRLASLEDLVTFLKEVKQLQEIRSEMLTPIQCRVLSEIAGLGDLVGWTHYLQLIQRLAEKQMLHKRFVDVERVLRGRIPTLSFLTKLINRLRTIEDRIDKTKLSESELQELSKFSEALHRSNQRLAQLGSDLNGALEAVGRIIDEIDFRFLYDEKKKLFVIGYNIENGRRDSSYYDLLASEARLASLVAVAKGQVSHQHWFMLNRSLTDSAGGKALLSWSATMFEYLMPLLVMRDFAGTLLSDTYRAVVKAQQVYGRKRGVPWGVSESAYSGVDFEKTYQYRAFGVPGLGLKRGLSDDLVISPYSTFLALPVSPKGCISNVRRLEKLGVRGEYGFYEAVDFTQDRLSAEEKFHIVKSFLAHHQGMSLVSINNYLNDNIVQKRFHSDPSIKSCDLLLQERFPSKIPVLVPHQAELLALEQEELEMRAERSERIKTPFSATPRARVISNGRYTVMLDSAGAGTSMLDGDLTLTRWREDSISNMSGHFIYLRDLESGRFWSSAYLPSQVEPDDYEVFFNPDKIEYRRRDHSIALHTEVTVSPEDNVEIRNLTVTNLSGRLRELEVTSYGEVALAPRRADLAHQAFSKLFISSEYLSDYDALIFMRRKRSEKEKPLFMAHMISMPIVWAPVQYETNRANFLGRGRRACNPAAFDTFAPLTKSVGTVLDPVFALRTKVEVDPGASQTVTFITLIAEGRDELINLIKKYHERHNITRAFELAWSQSDVEIRHQQFSVAQVHAFQHLANFIIYNVPEFRAPPEILKRNTLSQTGLWRFGISGDEPIVLVSLNDPSQAKLAYELLLSHEYLRLRGIKFDLVLLNEYPGGYMQNFQEELEFMIKSSYSRHFYEKRAGVFLRTRGQLSDEEIRLLFSAARVVLNGEKGSIAQQLKIEIKDEGAPSKPGAGSPFSVVASDDGSGFRGPEPKWDFANGFGGFTQDGKAYAMRTRYDQLPPLPWANVVANRDFGFLITESGAGYTWSDNSRENRLTNWSNDPISDPFSEVIYIRDSESGDYWCPTVRPVNHGELVIAEHAFGHSDFVTRVNSIHSHLSISAATQDRVKWWNLELTNSSKDGRELELYLYIEWVLGVSREETYRYIISSYDNDGSFLYATNPFNIDFSNHVTFVGCSHSISSYTANRKEFLGRLGEHGNPRLLEDARPGEGLGQLLSGGKRRGVKLSKTTGAGFDPCAVLKVDLTLGAGEKRNILFYMGQAGNIFDARTAASRYRSMSFYAAERKAQKELWDGTLGALQVQSPDRSFDFLANGWLLYQTLSCRMFARTGFFQSSGALGFRDQLQDSMAMLLVKPELTKRQILLNATRQFLEGDVQHWWHPPSGKGVRTKISDNYLWLPFAVLEYLRVTGDRSILEESATFLEGPLLDQHQMEVYITPQVSNKSATIYEHCLIALDRSMVVGERGLPLIGAGDWNDGMNAVGEGGKGESVWLAWFLADILNRFAGLVEERKDNYRATKYREHARGVVNSIEQNAWDGEWYIRAFFDDGTPIGSSKAPECKIDSLVQSWSVITGLGRPDRQEQSLASIYKHLVRPQDKVICLLTSPFVNSVPSPGYIQGYPAGLRENGGQYTHAAAWVVMAHAVAGMGSRAFELFQIVNPINHTKDTAGALRYQTEPYVTCGDVYSVPPHAGRGGWSWYTGSSGWLYRVAWEHILGLKIRGDKFAVEPCIPSAWKEFNMKVSLRGTTFNIKVLNPTNVERGVQSVQLEGQELPSKEIPFSAGQGNVVVIMG